MTDKAHITGNMKLAFADFLQRIAPAVTAIVTLRLGMLVYGVEPTERYLAMQIILVLLTLILFRPAQTDSPFGVSARWARSISIFWSWLILIAVLLLIGYATKTSESFSRKLLLAWAGITPFAIFLAKLAIDKIVLRLVQSRSSLRRVVIAGVNDHARLLAEKIANSSHLGLSLDGHFDDRGLERLGEIDPNSLLGRLAELPEYVRKNRIDLIYIALPIRNIQRVTDLLDDLHDTTASIYYLPDVFVFDLVQCRTDEVGGLPVVALCETPYYGSRGVVKRISDFVIALSILILIAPILFIIAIAIKATTPGTVIFKQRRYGLDGREITVYKFRTMYVSEDSDKVRQATRDDDRVTRIGAILRRYSLDELPQFLNVLQGNMSVVGPRPHAIAHNEEYRRLIKGYMIRHKVKPGVTGLAQVRGFRGETATVEDMRNRVEADLEYLRNWTIELDLRIIFRTLTMMFLDKTAY